MLSMDAAEDACKYIKDASKSTYWMVKWKMALYRVRHKEVLVSFHDIEADSPEEAVEKFEAALWKGEEVDLCDMEMVEEENTAHEIE